MKHKKEWLALGSVTCVLVILGSSPFLAAQGQQNSSDTRTDVIRKRQEWFYQQRAYPLGYIPAGARLQALKELDKMLEAEGRFSKQSAVAATPVSPTQWTLIGPQPTNTPYGYPITSGRVTALAVDPRNANVVYLGAAEGGVWKTTNGGSTWTPLTDTQPSLAVGSIALDPSNPDIVYVGTGEENFTSDNYGGSGILKSTDGGSTWTQLGASAFAGPFTLFAGVSVVFCAPRCGGGAYIGSLAVHPTNGKILLAAVGIFETGSGDGIYRSTDGGVSWTIALSGAAGTGVIFDPTNGNIAYAALGYPNGIAANGVYKSTDGGLTWARADAAGTRKLPTAANVGRIALAITPSSPTTLYASIALLGFNTVPGGAPPVGLFKSLDGGANWTQITTIPVYCTSQCDYDNVVAVSPTNASIVFVGGQLCNPNNASAGCQINNPNNLPNGMAFSSQDGGSTWHDISNGANGVGLHPDHHAFAFSSDGLKLYAGNDGGVWSTTDVSASSVNWTNLNSSLATTQFYPGLSIHPTNVNIAFGGTQDNGTEQYTGSLAWNWVTCGDGGWTAIDPAMPTTVYSGCGSLDVNLIQKSTSGGATGWTSAQNGIQNEVREFIPPLVIDPSNPLILYFGTSRVYQTINGAGAWTAISTAAVSPLTTIAVAPSDSNTLYVGDSNSKVKVTTNALAGAGSTWTDRSAGLPPRAVTQIAVVTAYVTFSGFSGFSPGDNAEHVFKTTTGGASWTDISGNLPNIPVNDMVVDPDIPNTLYAATDIGVFTTSNGGATWSTLVAGLPRVAVTGLKLHRPTRTLRAGTHGRSVWDLQVPLPGKALPALNIGGAVNAASFAAGAAVAPGSIVSVFGSNLASSNVSADAVPLPTSLGGVGLRFNSSLAAPAFFASPSQMNVQIPWELANQSQATVAATVGGITFNAATVSLASFAPGIFTTNQQGGGQGAILIAASGEVAAPAGSISGRVSLPAARGEFVTIYCTGLGTVTNQPASGAAASGNPLSATTSAPNVTIGGIQAMVNFSGLAPGFVGLYQVNAQVPQDAPPGDAIPVMLNIGGATSSTVTMAVQ